MNNLRFILASTTVLFIVALFLPGCAQPESDSQAIAQVEYMFFPPPPETPRIQFLCYLRGTEDFAKAKTGLAQFIVGEEVEVHKTVGKPYGVAVQGPKVFVTDTKVPSIVVIDVAEQSFESFGKTGQGALRKPINIRQDGSGRLYVTDTLRNQIVVFDTDGTYVGEYGDGEEFRPADVIVTDAELFVLDIASHGVKVYDLQTRQLTRSFGGRGKGFGEFNYPTTMVMDQQGDIYVCDSLNFRVQKIDRQGKSLLIFGRPGKTPGHFARPRGLAVDRDGIIYVVDSVLGVVQLFNKEGEPLMHIGETGTGPGRLYLPAQVIVDYDSVEAFSEYICPDFDAKYLIFVTNQLGPNKVSVYAFGTSASRSTAAPE